MASDIGTRLYDLANTLPDPDADTLREAADELARVTAERDALTAEVEEWWAACSPNTSTEDDSAGTPEAAAEYWRAVGERAYAAEDRAEKAEAERDRARSAGRRLADYWRVQADGAEALHGRVMTHWRSALGSALGLDMPLLSEILASLDGEGE